MFFDTRNFPFLFNRIDTELFAYIKFLKFHVLFLLVVALIILNLYFFYKKILFEIFTRAKFKLYTLSLGHIKLTDFGFSKIGLMILTTNL